MDRCGTREGYLIVFDRRKRNWEEKIIREETEHEGRAIQIWGMWATISIVMDPLAYPVA